MEVGSNVRQSIQGQLHGKAKESPGFTIYDPFKEAKRLGMQIKFQQVDYFTQQYQVHNCQVKFPYIKDHNYKLNYFLNHEQLYKQNQSLIDGQNSSNKTAPDKRVELITEKDIQTMELMNKFREKTLNQSNPDKNSKKKQNSLLPNKSFQMTNQLSESSDLLNQLADGFKQTTQSHIALTNFNYSFQLCETYHPLLMFPAHLERNDLLYMAQFRSNRRLVICCWSKLNKPVLARCAQPMQGGQKQADSYDKLSFTAICTQKFPKIILFDARPPLNAKANQLIGKGVEKVSQYECVDRLVYLNLANIHGVREAFNNLKAQIIDYQQKVLYGSSGFYNNFGILSNIQEKEADILQEDENFDSLYKEIPFLFNHSDLFVIQLQQNSFQDITQQNIILESSDIKDVADDGNGDAFQALDCSMSFSKGIEGSVTDKMKFSSLLIPKQRQSHLFNSFLRKSELSDMCQLAECGQGDTIVVADVFPQKLQGAITSYLQLKRQLLTSGYLIANSIQAGFNCIIHCSDGWDRTPQLSALTQLFIDPFYRTVHGFCVLIQKEFMSFGHRFGTRTGSFPKTDQKEMSPIFHLFLEVVAEILKQNQDKFEFSEDFLVYLAFSIKSRQFGDFMFDSEAERLVNEVHKLTNSVFDDVEKFKVNEINDDSDEENLLIIDINVVNIWETWWWQHAQ